MFVKTVVLIVLRLPIVAHFRYCCYLFHSIKGLFYYFFCFLFVSCFVSVQLIKVCLVVLYFSFMVTHDILFVCLFVVYYVQFPFFFSQFYPLNCFDLFGGQCSANSLFQRVQTETGSCVLA